MQVSGAGVPLTSIRVLYRFKVSGSYRAEGSKLYLSYYNIPPNPVPIIPAPLNQSCLIVR